MQNYLQQRQDVSPRVVTLNKQNGQVAKGALKFEAMINATMKDALLQWAQYQTTTANSINYPPQTDSVIKFASQRTVLLFSFHGSIFSCFQILYLLFLFSRTSLLILYLLTNFLLPDECARQETSRFLKLRYLVHVSVVMIPAYITSTHVYWFCLPLYCNITVVTAHVCVLRQCTTKTITRLRCTVSHRSININFPHAIFASLWINIGHNRAIVLWPNHCTRQWPC